MGVFSMQTSTVQIFFFLHHSACNTALLLAVIWPTAASINIQLLHQRYQGTLRGPMRQTSGRPCCSYLPRLSGQGSAIRSFGCLCYQQGRLVRVEEMTWQGLGGGINATFYQWIMMGEKRQRKVKKQKEERAEWRARPLDNTVTLSWRSFFFFFFSALLLGVLGQNWLVGILTPLWRLRPTLPTLADVSKVCPEGWKGSRSRHLVFRNYTSHIHSKWLEAFRFSESWETEGVIWREPSN